MERGWLARALRLVTDVALVGWLLLMGWVLVILVQQRMPDGSGVRQANVHTELELPVEAVGPAADGIEVFNFEAISARIHYRTTQASGFGSIARVVLAVLVGWGVVAGILWQVRQVLASFVRRQPLTLENARRFQIISMLMLLGVAFTAISRTIEYLRLEPLFPIVPQQGFFSLLLGHVEWTQLLTALLILLLAEALRLGAEHRMDSEAVV
jgi:hypothetical protein